MAKNTTKDTGAKPVDNARTKGRQLADEIRKLEESQALRATDRAIRWARLIYQLEGFLDHAHVLGSFPGPELAHGELDLSPREEFLNRSLRFQEDLQLAENWLPMIGSEYKTGHSLAIADVRSRLKGEPPVDAISTNAESLAIAIVCVRMLLHVELARAKSHAGVPSDDDLALLRRLRDKPKTAKELAVEIAGKGKEHNADEKRVERAIERLRDVHGFELPNTRGSGYSLSKSDQAQLDKLAGLEGT